MDNKLASINDSSDRKRTIHKVFIYLLLMVIILAGAYFRFSGVDWDAGRHLHPDERFLSMVESAIIPAASGSYFDTQSSTLNPANNGYTFFVYGTLPVFLIRYIGEWTGQLGYDQITILGRQLSAIFDLLTILLVFLVGTRLYKPKVGLLAAAFYAFAVLPIQLSHFMTVDSFTNTFGMLTVFAAVLLLTRPLVVPDSTNLDPINIEENRKKKFSETITDFSPYLFFGAALGMATASKINAVSLALLLPLIEFVRLSKLPKPNQERLILGILARMAFAALISFLVFRFFQPYAFVGPSFFNFRIDPDWWASLRSLSAQAAGEVDYPPALQWARRPITFSLTNMVQWGLGLPLGIAALVSTLGMGWLIIREKHLDHLPLWAWTVFYFSWQALSWTRSMRYQMLVYPLFVLFAAWGLLALWQNRGKIKIGSVTLTPKILQWVGGVLIVLVLLSSVAWSFAFTRIYTRDHSRVAASQWIYANISGPLNLILETEEGETFYQLPYRVGDTLSEGQNYQLPFIAQSDSLLTNLVLPSVTDLNSESLSTLKVSVFQASTGEFLSASTLSQQVDFPETLWQGGELAFAFETAAEIKVGELYFIDLKLEGENGSIKFKGSPSLNLILMDGTKDVQSLLNFTETITVDHPYVMDSWVPNAATIKALRIPRLIDLNLSGQPIQLALTLNAANTQGPQVASAYVTDPFDKLGQGAGTEYTFELAEPLVLDSPQMLNVSIEMVSGNGRLAISAPSIAHESSWDDGLPVGMEGYYPYNEEGGLFRGGLNFEMYWPDDQAKLTRFETTLDQADYIFISSNRQWGTTTRVPERYPLTSAFYRSLLGCPPDKEIIWCYNTAEPGDFVGSFGFELISVFDSYPSLGSLEFNDQFAEEAFSVYDHPKVLIFKKVDSYNPREVREILRQVDLSKVINMTAKQASEYSTRDLNSPKVSLNLSEEALATQRNNGTWSELFDGNAAINLSPTLAVIGMYLFVWLLGLVIFPFLSLALPGLSDRGYAFMRIAGMMILAYLVWLAGSNGIAYSRTNILLVIGILIIIGLILGFIQRKTLLHFLKQEWRYILVVEAVSLASFLFFLFVRIQNPDLWHPWKGGEKPMDFSYLNAILKSTTFPPYDPWFAGGYINYYYYGQMMVSVPIKLLGIIPSTAYNIILPLLYSMLCQGAFSIGWQLYQTVSGAPSSEVQKRKRFRMALLAGIATVLILALLGNLGTIRLIIQSFQKMASGGINLEDANLIQKTAWFFRGLGLFLQDTPLPLYPGDWYWIPSRVIPGEAITEFPYFTYLYADLHAHLIALPMVLLAIAWGISVLRSKCCWSSEPNKHKGIGFIFSILLGALVIGALKPTNTWDYYTFLVLNLAILGYSGWRSFLPTAGSKLKPLFKRVLMTLIPIIILAALSKIMYLPFDRYFGQGYSQIGYWTGEKTPLAAYLVHWGFFLFLITSWFVWETYQWMANTPMSSLRKLDKFKPWIIGVGALFLVILFALLITKVTVALVVVPLGVWAIVLLIKSDQSDAKRLVIFMVGTALLLTLAVELFHLVGDIGRMNFVFKLYNQAWVLFALSAGFCLTWTLHASRHWRIHHQTIWQIILIIFVFNTALFPLLATKDKIKDRMDLQAEQGLDGMAYMQTATYFDNGTMLNFVEDYHAIQWMQDNVKGSPVILEGQAFEYRWGNRFTIYTGLPGVVGWNYHQRQQRAILRSNIVQERVDAVGQFYLTEDQKFVENFIAQYDIRYIIFGQLERSYYPGIGLNKFEALDGILWDEVYRYGSTIIYEVRQ